MFTKSPESWLVFIITCTLGPRLIIKGGRGIALTIRIRKIRKQL